jgi:hypothetical protein
MTCANCERLETEMIRLRDELILEKRLHNALRERYTAKEQELIRLRKALTKFVEAFGPIERKPYGHGLTGTYLAPAGSMIQGEIAEMAIEALKEVRHG